MAMIERQRQLGALAGPSAYSTGPHIYDPQLGWMRADGSMILDDIYAVDGNWYPADYNWFGMYANTPEGTVALADAPPPPPPPPVPAYLLGEFKGVRNSAPDPNEPYYQYLTDPRYDPPSIWPAPPGTAWVKACDDAGNNCQWQFIDAFDVNQGGFDFSIGNIVHSLAPIAVGGMLVTDPVAAQATGNVTLGRPIEENLSTPIAIDIAAASVFGGEALAPVFQSGEGLAAPELLAGPPTDAINLINPVETWGGGGGFGIETPDYLASAIQPEAVSPEALINPVETLGSETPEFAASGTGIQPEALSPDLVSEPPEALSPDLVSEPPGSVAASPAGAAPAAAAAPSIASTISTTAGLTSLVSRVNDLIKHAAPQPPKQIQQAQAPAPGAAPPGVPMDTGSLIKYAAIAASLFGLLS